MKTRRWVDFRTEQEYGKALNQLLTHIFEYSDDQKSPIPTVLSEDRGKTAEPLVRPPVAPQQWILVAGTGITSKFTPELAELSRYLGNSLGTKGYGIITGGWPGVDETVARAFYAATKQLGSPLEDCLVQVVVNSKDPAFPAGQLVFVDRGDDEWSEPIRRADAIVLLGGVGGTWTTGKMALKMRRPVLPLADTGGDAKKLYIHMLKTWDEYAWMNIGQTQFQTLANPGSDGVEAALILLSNIPKGGITA